MREREKLVESMVTFVPMLHKKVVKSLPPCELSKLQFELLFKICKNNGKPMSYYSEKMMMPRSNLTVLSDKLIEERLIERLPDPVDRRVISLKLTTKGEHYIAEQRTKIGAQMMKLLAQLNDEDVIRLNSLIEEMKSILNKIIN